MVGDDGAIRRRISHASQHEAVVHLIVVEEGLVALINLSRLHAENAYFPVVVHPTSMRAAIHLLTSR